MRPLPLAVVLMATLVQWPFAGRAAIRLLPVFVPERDVIRLEVQGIAPGQRPRVESSAVVPTTDADFVPRSTGSAGQTTFEFPVEAAGAAYFRVVADTIPGPVSRLRLTVPPFIGPVSPGVPVRVASAAELDHPVALSLEGGLLRIRSGTLEGAEDRPVVAAGGGLRVDDLGGVWSDAGLVARVSDDSAGWTARLSAGCTPDVLLALVRQVALVPSGTYPGSPYHTIQWTLEDDQARSLGGAMQVMEVREDCGAGLDAVLVLDRTGSLSVEDLAHLRTAATNFVERVAGMAGGGRVGVVSFCGAAHVHAALSADPARVLDAIDEVQRGARLDNLPCEETYLGAGIEAAIGLLSSSEAAGRTRVILLLTDGWENARDRDVAVLTRGSLEAGRQARLLGMHLIACGVGPEPDSAHLVAVAGDAGDYLAEPDYVALESRIAELAPALCPAPANRPPVVQVVARQEVWLPAHALLTAGCTDCGGQPRFVWRRVAGPGTVAIHGAGQGPSADVAFSTPGLQQFAVDVANGPFHASALTEVLVRQSNAAPEVTIAEPVSAGAGWLLQGVVVDDGIGGDGLPSSQPLSVHWSQVNGNAAATFDHPDSLVTHVVFDGPGDPVAELTVRDAGGLVARARVTLRPMGGSGWESHTGVGYTSAAVGGLRGFGDGTLQVTGIRGTVRRALLYWHGPADSLWPDANASIRFAGRWVTGRSLGASHDDGWTYARSHPFAAGLAYRADVTHWVRKDGTYPVEGLRKGEEIEANGASLIVLFEEPDPVRRQDVWLWSGNDSNGSWSPSVDGPVEVIQVVPSGEVLMGGGFTHAGGWPRSRVTRLLADGTIDLAFDPGAGPDGPVSALLSLEGGGVLVGGDFGAFQGGLCPGLVRLDRNGLRDPGWIPQLPEGTRVRALLETNRVIWVGTSEGLLMLEEDGRLKERTSVVGDVAFLLPAAAGDGVVCGGERVLDLPGPRVSLALVDGKGVAAPYGPEFDGPVRTGAWGLDGGLFVGGAFSTVSGLDRHGVVHLLADGTVDPDWLSIDLNQFEGQEVNALLVQHPGDPWAASTRLLVVGGRLRVPAGDQARTASMVRLVEGVVSGDGFQALYTPDTQGVRTLARAGADDRFWIGGEFQVGANRNRALLGADGVPADNANAGDEGWALRLPVIPPGAPPRLELHVSDGQRGTASRRFLDPVVAVDGTVVLEPSNREECDRVDRQLFTGGTVPDAHHECWENLGLWDLVPAPLPPEAAGDRAGVLQSRYQDDPTQQDYVSLVAAVILRNSGRDVIPAPSGNALAAEEDAVDLLRSGGVARVDVLQNDIAPGMIRITAATSESGVPVGIDAAHSVLVYNPALLPDGLDGDRVTYEVVDETGNSSTGRLSVSVHGPAPIPLPMEAGSITTNLVSGPSPARGPEHPSRVFTYHASGAEAIDLSLTDLGMPAHLYVVGPSGDRIGSAAFPVDPSDPEQFADPPLELSVTLAEAGDYLIEVAGDRPRDTGDFTLSVWHHPMGDAAIVLRVDDLVVDDGYDLGVMAGLERRLVVRVENLTGFTLEDVTIEVFDDRSWLAHEIAPVAAVPVPAGGTVAWNWTVRRTDDPGGPQDVSLPLRVLAGGQLVRFAELRLRVDDGPPGLFLELSPVSGTVVGLKATALQDGEVLPTTFRITSPAGQQWIRSPDDRGTWSNAVPGRYRVVARTDRAVSQEVDWTVHPPVVGGILQAATSRFSILADSVRNRLVLPSGGGATFQVRQVGEPAAGSVSVTSEQDGVWYTPLPGVVGIDRFPYEATASDGSPVNGFIEVSIEPVSLRLVTPEEGAVVVAGTPVRVEAESLTASEAVARVRFFADRQVVGDVFHPPYAIDWTPEREGFFVLRAERLGEAGGVTASPPLRVGVAIRGDQPPIARLESPAPRAVVRQAALEVQGTAMDVDGPVTYALELADAAGHRVASSVGSGPVESGLLGELDLTLLRNGVYDLSLSVTGGVRVVEDRVRLLVEGEAKVGRLSFQETDLELPAAGAPLVIARTYDSLDVAGGDFGPGWRLSLQDLAVELDEEREQRWDDEAEAAFDLRTGGDRDVTLTLPGGRRTTFAFNLVPGAAQDGVPCFCYRGTWEAPPGEPATLAPIGADELRYIPFQQEITPFWMAAGPGTPMENFDFPGWTLSTPDGTTYRIERPLQGVFDLDPSGSRLLSAACYGTPRLVSVRFRGGEQVDIQQGETVGVAHRDALGRVTRRVRLVRDDRQRIAAVFDGAEGAGPSLPAVRYGYDAVSGNLVSVSRLTDRRTGHHATHGFEYTNATHPHLLTGLRDERGVRTAAPAYDPSGRLSSLLDAEGQGTAFNHDLRSRRTTVRDAGGAVTVHDYDAAGNVVQTAYPDGSITRRSYDLYGHVLAETNGWGTSSATWVTRGYDAAGRLVGETNAARGTWFTYDDQGSLRRRDDSSGVATLADYDAAGRLVASRVVASNLVAETRFQYDEAGRLVGTRDAQGTRVVSAYDDQGQWTQSVTSDANGRVLAIRGGEYDALGNRVREWGARAGAGGGWETNSFRHAFDARGRATEDTAPSGATRSRAYDDAGRVVSERDEAGVETRYTYNRRGLQIQTLHAGDDRTPRTVVRTVYDAMGRPAYTQAPVYLSDGQDPEASETEAPGAFVAYDAMGRALRTGRVAGLRVGMVRSEDGTVETAMLGEPRVLSWRHTHYDDAGRVDWTEDQSGLRAAYGYDDAGRRIAVTNGFGDESMSVTRTVYGPSGLIDATIDPMGRITRYEYDALGRRTCTWPPAEAPAAVGLCEAYDIVGRRVATTNELGIATLFAYDGAGRLVAVTNAAGRVEEAVTRYAYDEGGNLVSQTDALGRVTRYGYDSEGHRVWRQLPGGQREDMAYDAVGRMVAHTNFNGRVILQHYDCRGRLVRRAEAGQPEGTPPLAAFTYTASGQRETQEDPSGGARFAYDDEDRLVRKEQPGWGTLEYAYDAAGDLESTTVSAGGLRWRIEYRHDRQHRLTRAAIPEFDVSSAYTLAADGSVQGIRYGNGLSSRATYDAGGNLSRLEWLRGGEEWASFAYTFNSAGQKVRATERLPGVGQGTQERAWEYDARQRLVRESLGDRGELRYVYDKVGNRLERVSTVEGIPSVKLRYDVNDQIDPDEDPGNPNPDYDAAGNALRPAGAGGVALRPAVAPRREAVTSRSPR